MEIASTIALFAAILAVGWYLSRRMDKTAIRLFLEGVYNEYKGSTPRLEAALRRLDALSADFVFVIEEAREEKHLAAV